MIAPSEASVRIAGDPDAVELLARQLSRHAAVCADRAQADAVAGPAAWLGAASDVFTEATSSLAAVLRAAADDAGIASTALTRYAAQLRACQQTARHARRLIDEGDHATAQWAALPAGQRPAADPGEPLRTDGWRLLEQAARDVDDAARVTAWLFNDLLPAAAASQSRDGVVHRVAAGAGESGMAILQGVWSCGLPAVFTPRKLVGCAAGVVDGLSTAAQHPKQAAKDLLDWDMWAQDPPRAAGRLLPNALLTVATGGGRLAEYSARLGAAREVPVALRRGPHRLNEINGAPGGPHFDNCPSCVIATDLTLSGAPSSAIPDRPTMLRDLADRYDSMFVMADRDWITEQLSNAPSGARGIVFGMRDGREGHVFNAVQENGRVYFIDGQTGAPAVFQDSYVKLFFLRTDGRTPVGALNLETP